MPDDGTHIGLNPTTMEPEVPKREALVLTKTEDDVLKQKVAGDLGLLDVDKPEATALALRKDPTVIAAADKNFASLVEVSMTDAGSVTSVVHLAQTMGLETQQASAMKNAVMGQYIRQLGTGGETSSELRNDMVDLREITDKLDPHGFDFSVGTVVRVFAAVLPDKLSHPVTRYFLQFETGSVAIDTILKRLDAGYLKLQRNNDTLIEEQADIRQLTIRLLYNLSLGMELRARIEAKIAELPAGSPVAKFLKEQVLFEINMRCVSMGKQLLVNQQGYMSMEIARGNNQTLMRAVLDTRNVTVAALNIAVFLAYIINDQKLTLEVIGSLNATTSELILRNAKLLRSEGLAIQKEAVEGGLEMDKLKEAFVEISGAVEDYEKFRNAALEPQGKLIAQLADLSAQAEESIQRIEKGHVAQGQMIDIAPPIAA
ncbi:MAG: Toxic anion resistance family protein [Parcubacteria group bacterium GW2011_GWA2_40_23]|nr:MAG: Toxic anion resistance family protein [Parcubacteria group bacterium GW2011_GWA2_40_23]